MKIITISKNPMGQHFIYILVDTDNIKSSKIDKKIETNIRVRSLRDVQIDT